MMNKKLFSLLVILMSLSLIGIIFVQAYYINNSLETKEEQFTFNVKKALTYTTNQVADTEYKKYVKALNKIISDGIEPDTTAIRNITVYKQDNTTNQIIVYNTGILEENFKVPSLIDLNIDSLGLSSFRGKTTTKIYDNNVFGGDLISTSEQSFEKVLECPSAAGIQSGVRSGLGIALLNGMHVTDDMDVIENLFPLPPSITFVARVNPKSRSDPVKALVSEIAREFRVPASLSAAE